MSERSTFAEALYMSMSNSDAQLRELGWVNPVRCLDCIHFDCRSNGWGYCHSPALDGTGGPEMVVGYDDWCSFGEAGDDGD